MSQQHIIGKQILELTLPCQETAFALQNKISDLVRNRITPMLDALFEEFNNTDTVYRFDSLELDLGRISPDALSKELGERVVDRLRVHLNTALSADNESGEMVRGVTQKTEKSGRNAEMVLYFLHTGVLPWWADSTDKNILIDCWQELLLHDTEKAQQVARWFVRNKQALTRFVFQFPDELLMETVVLLQGSKENARRLVRVYQETIDFLKERHIMRQGDEAHIRQQMWRIFFTEAARLQGSLAEQVILQKADNQLMEAVRENLPGNYDWLASRIRDLLALLQITPALARHSYEKELRPHFWRIFLTLLQGCEDNSILLNDVLKEFADRYPQTSPDLLRELKDGMKLQPQKSDHLATEIPERDYGSCEDREIGHLMDEDFCDAEEVTVHNAGLVLLWPFLAKIFAGLHLIHKGKFINDSARQRALFLLQYLVEGESGSQEFLLPLNKVLCGFDLLTPAANNWELSEVERQECDTLVAAVIQHWQALKNISKDGFRRTFLQRRGLLLSRDSDWLLRVERQGCDVLLDKLPWSINVIKLPWLQELLVVEW